MVLGAGSVLARRSDLATEEEPGLPANPGLDRAPPTAAPPPRLPSGATRSPPVPGQRPPCHFSATAGEAPCAQCLHACVRHAC